MSREFIKREGNKVWRIKLESDGTVTRQTIEDVEPIIERNKRMQNDSRNRNSEWVPAYGVPMIMVSKWLHELGVNFLKLPKDEMRKFLHKKIATDPDYKYFRTRSGRY